MTIRTLTDATRGECPAYSGVLVPMNCGICIDDLKKTDSPSYTALLYYRQQFKSDSNFIMFVQDIIRKPTGTALEGRLTWNT